MFVKYIENFLTKEECDLVLKFSLENLTLNTATTLSNNGSYYETNRRKSNVVFYPYYEKFPFLLEKISKLGSFLGGFLKKGAYYNQGSHMKREPIDMYELRDKHWK